MKVRVPLRHTLLSVRDLLVTFAPFIVLALVLLALAFVWLKPNPPKRVVLATGPDQGAYAEFGKRYAAELRRSGIEVAGRHKLSVNEGNAYLAATLAGLGIAQVVRFQALPHLERGELVELLHEWQHPLIPLHVVYPPNRHLSARVRAFVEWTVELFARQAELEEKASSRREPAQAMAA